MSSIGAVQYRFQNYHYVSFRAVKRLSSKFNIGIVHFSVMKYLGIITKLFAMPQVIKQRVKMSIRKGRFRKFNKVIALMSR